MTAKAMTMVGTWARQRAVAVSWPEFTPNLVSQVTLVPPLRGSVGGQPN